MKHLSFKLLLICILAPPLLYVLSLQAAESWLQERYRSEIEESYAGETVALLNGRIRLRQAVGRNIEHYLSSLPLMLRGQRIDVTISSKDGVLVYPPVFESQNEAAPEPADPLQVAAENYRLLSRGLVLNLRVSVPFASPLAVSMLSVFVLSAVAVLFFAYNRGVRQAQEEENHRQQEIDRLRKIKERYSEKMDRLETDRTSLSIDLNRLKKELLQAKERADRNEDAMIEEIAALEKELETNLSLQREQDEMIKALQEQIQKAERSGQKAGKQRRRHREMAAKRFQAIYKHLVVHERAVDGFLDLSEEMKIRAEEVVHQLDADRSSVTVKRKVFSKKGTATAFEVVFGSRGRLYFRNASQRLEILAIGTKNSQNRDLDYIERL